jgi:cation:H+ antiporter
VILGIGLLLVGAVVLFAGAGAAARGAAGIASARGEQSPLVGALFLGMSPAPVVLAVYLSARGGSATAAAVLFGTVVFVLSAGLAAAILIAGKSIAAPEPGTVVNAGITMVVALALASSSSVGRFQGFILMAAFGVWAWLTARGDLLAVARWQTLRDDAVRGLRVPFWLLAAGGLAVAVAGAILLTTGGSRVGAAGKLSAGLVGAAILGPLASVGTVRTLLQDVRRDRTELAVGHLFGTVAWSVGALGLAAVVRPIALDPAATVALIAAAALYALDGAAFLWLGHAGWRVALALIAADVGWIWLALRV